MRVASPLPTVFRALLALGLLSSSANADRRWVTIARPQRYLSLLVTGDTLWCGTLETGLLRFLRSAGTLEAYTKQPNGIASNRVTALARNREGRLWVGTQGAGVSWLEPDRSTWGLLNAFDGLPSDSITVLRAQGDTLWIGTVRGLALWNGFEIAGRLPDGVNPSPFANNTMTGLVVRGDSLWVATLAGVYVSRISTGLSSWSAVNGGLFWPIVDGLAWDGASLIALAGGDPFRFDDATGEWQWQGGVGYVQRLSDTHGIILGSSDRGLIRWAGTGWTMLGADLKSGPVCESKDPACPELFAATVDDSGHFAAANGTGIYLERAGAWTLFVPPGPPSNDIINLELDADWLYVSTFGQGVGRFDGRDWRLWLSADCGTCDTSLVSPAYAFALMRDRYGRKWAGSWSNAIESFDDRADPPSFLHYWWHVPDSLRPELHRWAWASATDLSGGRWFGMDTPLLGEPCCPAIGLEYYDNSDTGAYVRNYSPANSGIVNGKIHGLTVDKAGQIWVGYSPGGIGRFLPPVAAPFDIDLNPVTGTAGLDVQGLVARGDSIWALTTGALLRFDRLHPSYEGAVQYRIPGSPNQFAARPLEVGPDGSVWVGTESGARVFHPDGSTEDFSTFNSPIVNDIVRAIRVDPRTGVVWLGTAGGLSRLEPNYVPPPPPALPSLEVKVYPNPALLNGAGLFLRLAGNATAYHGAVYDPTGRRLHGFDGANGQVFWDGRDDSGNLVRPGIYFVRVEARGRARTVRVALLR